MTTKEKIEACTESFERNGDFEWNGVAYNTTNSFIVRVDAATEPLKVKLELVVAMCEKASKADTPRAAGECVFADYRKRIVRRIGERLVREAYFRLFPHGSEFFTAEDGDVITVRHGGELAGVLMPYRQDAEAGLPIDPPSEAELYPDKAARDLKRLLEAEIELADAREALDKAEGEVEDWEETIEDLEKEIREIRDGVATRAPAEPTAPETTSDEEPAEQEPSNDEFPPQKLRTIFDTMDKI